MCRKDQCGWYGVCVAPNQCRCPRKYTRVIKLNEDGEVDEVSYNLVKTSSKVDFIGLLPKSIDSWFRKWFHSNSRHFNLSYLRLQCPYRCTKDVCRKGRLK